MTALDLGLIRKTTTGALQGRFAAHSLDRITLLQLVKRMVFTVNAAGIGALVGSPKDIPGPATNQMFQTAAKHNPNTFWTIAVRGQLDNTAPQGEGLLTALPLTHDGTRRLVGDTLDTKKLNLLADVPSLGVSCSISQRPIVRGHRYG